MIKFLSSSAEKICDQMNFSDMTYKNFGIIIRFKEYEAVQRYYYKSSRASKREFRHNATILFDCFWKYLDELGEKKIYIASSEDAPCRMSRFDALHTITDSDKVILTNNKRIIRRAFIKALKYELHPVFITENGHIAIMPTDHLDMFIASRDSVRPSELDVLLETVEWILK